MAAWWNELRDAGRGEDRWLWLEESVCWYVGRVARWARLSGHGRMTGVAICW